MFGHISFKMAVTFAEDCRSFEEDVNKLENNRNKG
jgi:hypothetical protein